MSEQKMSRRAKYKALIIGAGRIGAQFDSPQSSEILTHAHAYKKHPRINLIGFYDADKKAAKSAARKWKCSSFNELDKAMALAKPDIVSICTPNQSHYEFLLKIAKYKPKIVICEKPVTLSLEETKKIIKLYNKIKLPLLVNYSRRFDKAVQIVKDEIISGKCGKVLSASGIYTKGILHNGSHLIDLCRYFFGEIRSNKSLFFVDDYNRRDRSVASFLQFDKCKQFHLQVGDERHFSIFELDIILEKKRFQFFDFGFYLSTQAAVSDPMFQGYQCLEKPVITKTFLDKAMLAMINDAVEHLDKNKALISDAQSAFKTQKVCFYLLRNK